MKTTFPLLVRAASAGSCASFAISWGIFHFSKRNNPGRLPFRLYFFHREVVTLAFRFIATWAVIDLACLLLLHALSALTSVGVDRLNFLLLAGVSAGIPPSSRQALLLWPEIEARFFDRSDCHHERPSSFSLREWCLGVLRRAHEVSFLSLKSHIQTVASSHVRRFASGYSAALDRCYEKYLPFVVSDLAKNASPNDKLRPLQLFHVRESIPKAHYLLRYLGYMRLLQALEETEAFRKQEIVASKPSQPWPVDRRGRDDRRRHPRCFDLENEGPRRKRSRAIDSAALRAQLVGVDLSVLLAAEYYELHTKMNS